MPNGSEAYVAAAVVEATTKPVKYQELAADTDLLDEAHADAAAKDSIAAGSKVAVLGSYSQYNLVRDDAGDVGWINTQTTASTR